MDKIVFLDVDGTLTKGLSSWELVHHHFEKSFPGMVDAMNANTKLWKEGKISYQEWAELDVQLWKGKSFNELEKALLPPQLIEGARDGVQLLKENNFYTVLVSGGVNVMVEEVKRQIGADECFSYIIHEKNGKISGKVDGPVGNSKADIASKVIERKQIDISNSYAVGDHINDKEIFEFVKYSIGVNIKDKRLEQYSSKIINTDNFIDVAKIILNQN